VTNKITLDLYLAKFLDISAKSFSPCINTFRAGFWLIFDDFPREAYMTHDTIKV